AGDITYNYKVKGAPKLVKNKKYNELLLSYATPVPGKFALPGNLSEFGASSGPLGSIGGPGDVSFDSGGGLLSMPTLVSGAIGGLAAYTSNYITKLTNAKLNIPLDNPIKIAVDFPVGQNPVYVTLNTQEDVLNFASKYPAKFADAQKIPLFGGDAVVSPDQAAEVTKGQAQLASANTFTTALNAIGVAAAVFSLAMAIFGPGPKLMGSMIQSGIGLILAILPLFSITLGPFGAIAGILITLVFKFLGIGDTKEVIVSFTCQPWQAPVGGDNCKKCGGEEFPCSKYACQSLGQTCDFINEGSDNELCIDTNPNDVTASKITPWDGLLGIGFNYENSDSGYKLISNENDGCLKAYQPTVFVISTDEVAQCRLVAVHTDNFEDMEFDFGTSSLFLYNHSMEFLIPSLESLGIEGYDPNARADYKFYVRCQDKNGNVNENEYVIDFCIKPGDDIGMPVVVEKSPETENIAYATAEQGITLYVNEPVECRWDTTNKIYAEMPNQMDCDSSITEQTSKGWSCFAELPTSSEENNYFVRCIDQPWYAGVNESKRNTMDTSYSFKLKKTASTLTISSASPDGETLKFGSSPYSFGVIAKTSGGYDNGNAYCFWMIGNQQILFTETGGTSHKRIFNQFGEGNNALAIRCVDGIGNTADKTINFNIELDQESPLVTRVYSQGGSLIVVTNEDSECVYSLEGCSYNYADGKAFSGAGAHHSVGFTKGLIHYVKCKDSQGNVPGGCSVVVKEA
ncbi:MAG: hypothetical protein Q8L29_00080, partial [archaeon]|nr:hypothetical protein [archaeon]